MSDSIINAPRWLFLAALLFAPWAYGATQPWAIRILDCWMGTATALWVVSHLLRQQRPPIHPIPGFAILALLGQAWFMVLNAHYEYDTRSSTFVPLDPLLPWAPGSLHKSLSLESALHLTALLGAFCLVAEIARDPAWRRRLLWTLAGTGASVVLLGLTQKIAGATDIFWGSNKIGPNFFATFRNHTNAGAFINLCWPIAAGLALISFLRSSSLWKRILWTSLLVLTLSGVAANSSRAAGGLALFLVVLWIGWVTVQRLRGRFAELQVANVAIVAVALVGIVAAVAVIAGMDHTVRRWRQFDRQLTADNSRLLAAKVCVDMIPKAGAAGFGPGTFQTAFPYFTQSYGEKLKGKWIFAHQDYLQTAVEWGYIGSASWVVLVLGAAVCSLLAAFRKREELSDSARVIQFALLTALLGVLLHALVDFPLQIASIQLYVVTLLGLLWASPHWLAQKRRSIPARHSGRRELTPRVSETAGHRAP